MYLIKIFQKEYYLWILVITLQLLIAVSWALFNLGRLAIQEIQGLGC